MMHQISGSRPFSLKIMMNDIKVCVRNIDGNVVSGCICHCCLREPLPFRGMGDMVLKIDGLCDRLGFPEANPPRRSLSFPGKKPGERGSFWGAPGDSASPGKRPGEGGFGEKGRKKSDLAGGYREEKAGMKKKEEIRCYHEFKEFAPVRGEWFSFYIKLRYRQNASWQGSIHFSGDVKIYQFRSVLELLGYIMEKTEEFQKGGAGNAEGTFNR